MGCAALITAALAVMREPSLGVVAGLSLALGLAVATPYFFSLQFVIKRSGGSRFDASLESVINAVAFGLVLAFQVGVLHFGPSVHSLAPFFGPSVHSLAPFIGPFVHSLVHSTRSFIRARLAEVYT